MRGQRPAAEEGDRKAREDRAAEQNLHGSEIIGRARLLRAQPQEDDHADEGRDAQHQEDQHRLAHIDLDDVPHGRQQPDIRRSQRRGAEAEQDAVGKAKPIQTAANSRKQKLRLRNSSERDSVNKIMRES